MHTASSHIANAEGANANIPFGPSYLWLLSLPLFHIGGCAILFRSLISGGAIAIDSPGASIQSSMGRFPLTHLSLVPTQLYRLLAMEQEKAALQRLRAILLGGAPASNHLIEKAASHHLAIYLINRLHGHSDDVNIICFSPDGKLMASGSDDNTIKLWDTAQWKEIKTLMGHDDYVDSVCFSPDGKLLASGSDDNTIRIWDIEKGKEVKTLKGHNGYVWAVAFSPSGNQLASGSWGQLHKYLGCRGRQNIKNTART